MYPQMNADGRRWRGRFFLLSVLICVHLRIDTFACRLAEGAAAQPAVAVFESPLASRWLEGAGVVHLPVAADDLPALGPLGVNVLVLPLEQVRTEAQARWVADFVARGGKLLAVYWGTLVREAARDRYPVYTLASLLGVRPTGWRGADALVVRPGDSMRGTDEILDARLARGMLVRVEPQEGAAVLARWAPPGGAMGAAAGPLVVSFGGHLYLAVDLFAPQNDTPAARQLFFWALEQIAPQLVYGPSRARAGQAMAAVIRAEAVLADAQASRPEAETKGLKEKLTEARACAVRAKQAAAADRFAEVAAQSVRALALAEEVMKALGPGHGPHRCRSLPLAPKRGSPSPAPPKSTSE